MISYFSEDLLKRARTPRRFNDIFVKFLSQLTDGKFKAVSTRVGWVMVKYEDQNKYKNFDGTLDEYF